MKNVRFPHSCIIYTITGVTPFSDGERQEVWSGVCRKELLSVSTFRGSDSVPKSRYRIQLGIVDGGVERGAIVSGIIAGMLVDVEDAQGAFVGLEINDAYCGQLGTSLFCDESKT